jgi:tRNA threonylcarbamoyladenosine biosynthesis protein TsaE
MEIKTKSADETEAAGCNFGKKLKGGDVVLLFGDLGSGKTTFVKGIAKLLEIKDEITSPTFVFCKKYKIGDGSALCHYDCYRVSSREDVESIGLTEDLSDPNGNIILIEWPENINGILPEDSIEVHFYYTGESERRIKY